MNQWFLHGSFRTMEDCVCVCVCVCVLREEGREGGGEREGISVYICVCICVYCVRFVLKNNQALETSGGVPYLCIHTVIIHCVPPTCRALGAQRSCHSFINSAIGPANKPTFLK
jgi:hypothetical protein